MRLSALLEDVGDLAQPRHRLRRAIKRRRGRQLQHRKQIALVLVGNWLSKHTVIRAGTYAPLRIYENGDIYLSRAHPSTGTVTQVLTYTNSTDAVAINKATTLGGGYTAYAALAGGSPTCIVVPWYRRNSTTVMQTTSGTPFDAASNSRAVFCRANSAASPNSPCEISGRPQHTFDASPTASSAFSSTSDQA